MSLNLHANTHINIGCYTCVVGWVSQHTPMLNPNCVVNRLNPRTDSNKVATGNGVGDRFWMLRKRGFVPDAQRLRLIHVELHSSSVHHLDCITLHCIALHCIALQYYPMPTAMVRVIFSQCASLAPHEMLNTLCRWWVDRFRELGTSSSLSSSRRDLRQMKARLS